MAPDDPQPVRFYFINPAQAATGLVNARDTGINAFPTYSAYIRLSGLLKAANAVELQCQVLFDWFNSGDKFFGATCLRGTFAETGCLDPRFNSISKSRIYNHGVAFNSTCLYEPMSNRIRCLNILGITKNANNNFVMPYIVEGLDALGNI